jgi:hypothetical protein
MPASLPGDPVLSYRAPACSALLVPSAARRAQSRRLDSRRTSVAARPTWPPSQRAASVPGQGLPAALVAIPPSMPITWPATPPTAAVSTPDARQAQQPARNRCRAPSADPPDHRRRPANARGQPDSQPCTAHLVAHTTARRITGLMERCPGAYFSAQCLLAAAGRTLLLL